jgi:hypothetical protein|uniref:Uncharacterized protein n=1 Tax=Picea glauca TaxID=3330 RepID=A0A101LUE9_PICGL|nr:hypothetical protein ABT39_MTgene3416 [Picea glauca]
MKPNLINNKTTQILNGLLSEEALLALHLQFVSASHFRHQMHMLLMLIPCLTEKKDIIQVDHNKSTQVRMENRITKVLEGSRSVSEPKVHHQPFVLPKHGF